MNMAGRPANAAKAFIINGGKLLLVKRAANDTHKPGVWEIPGGRLEEGEDPFEGVKRDTKEETGIEIEPLYCLNVQHFTRQDGQTITMMIFLCRTMSREVRLSEEHSEYRWTEMRDVKKSLTPFFHGEVDIYTKFFSGLLL